MPRLKKETKPTEEKSTKKVAGKQEAVVATAAKETKKNGQLTIDVVDTKGKVVETMSLPEAIFGAKINKPLMSQAVRVYLANQHRGTASTKSRGEVRGSTRKIYRQKGTGRARHGGIRAPIFVHGGVAHGPKPRDYSLSLSKKMKKAALFSALSAKLADGSIKVVKGLELLEPKTKVMVTTFANLSLDGKKRGIVVIMPERIDPVEKAARNIAGVVVSRVESLNTYDVMRSKMLVFMQPAIEKAQQHFVKEIK